MARPIPRRCFPPSCAAGGCVTTPFFARLSSSALAFPPRRLTFPQLAGQFPRRCPIFVLQSFSLSLRLVCAARAADDVEPARRLSALPGHSRLRQLQWSSRCPLARRVPEATPTKNPHVPARVPASSRRPDRFDWLRRSRLVDQRLRRIRMGFPVRLRA